MTPDTSLPLQLDRDLVVLDTETTGADISVDRVIQLALIRLRPDGSRKEYETLVHPGMPIPIEAQRVHGISDAAVEFAPPFRRIAPEVLDLLREAALAGYNLLRFDIPLLRSEFQRAGHCWSLEGVRVLDAQVIFHKMEPRDLSAALRFYCGRDLVGAHGALADTRATLDVLLGQLERYPELPRQVGALDGLFHVPDPRFLDSQRRFTWRNGEATFNFGARKGQTLRDVACRNPDYLQWMLNRDFSEDVKALVAEALAGKFPLPPERASNPPAAPAV
jgi:DNA polymerase-3 subunit epsilon